MTNIMELNEHCRLCLVKDEVNIPIFEDEGDVRQVLLKITACLPVKIAKADSLPKRICDGCLYKLESFYQFWNTSVNSEKQLLQWLAETLNGDAEANLHALKQEPTDNLQTESQVYIQQQLAYQETENYGGYPEETTNYKPKKTSTKKERDREKRERERERKREEAEAEEEEEEEAPAPKRKRRAATKKPAIEVDDDDDDDEYIPPAAISKTEDDSDANDDPGDDYGGDDNASDDNADDDTEPGPSGTTKSTSDAPSVKIKKERKERKPRKLKIKKLKQKRQKSSKVEKISKKNSVYCDKCSNEFRSEAQLKAHLKTNICIHFCDFCNEHFEHPMEFIKHATQHSTEPQNLRCIYCEYFSVDENDMSEHIRDDHKKLPKFVCKTCHKNFHVYTWFIEHENLHTGLKPFICEYCGRSFVYSRYLAAHRSNMHKVELTGQKDHLVCPICSKEFERKKTYELHVYRHKGTQVICEICGKTLASKQKLKYHIRIHTGYKPFKCAYCVKCFTKKAFLVEHERIHTGERPYTCEHCNKGFSQRSSLVIHIRTHTGERPYVCHLCQKGFIGRAMLNIHFKHCKGFLE